MNNIDYELLALTVYDASDDNKTPLPTQDWSEVVPWQADDAWGFSAGAYKNGNQIVIAYAGTNQTVDWFTGGSEFLQRGALASIVGLRNARSGVSDGCRRWRQDCG